MTPRAWRSALTAGLLLWAGILAAVLYAGARPMSVLAVAATVVLAVVVLSIPLGLLLEHRANRHRARARARVEAWLEAEEQARRGASWTTAEALAIEELELAQRAAGRAAVARLFDRTELVADPSTVIEAGAYPPPPEDAEAWARARAEAMRRHPANGPATRELAVVVDLAQRRPSP